MTRPKAVVVEFSTPTISGRPMGLANRLQTGIGLFKQNHWFSAGGIDQETPTALHPLTSDSRIPFRKSIFHLVSMPVSSSSVSHRKSLVTDTALVEKLWGGDLTALGTLYDRYASLVYTTALRSLADVDSAEDLTQDVFLTLMHQRTYNPTRSSLSHYLCLLTRSRAIDRLRAQSTRYKYLNQWHRNTLPSENSPMEQVSQQEQRNLVQTALGELSQQQRQVLELSYYQGQSQTEIAAQLGVPLGTVKSWARRGLLKLRSQLQSQLEGEQK